MESARCCGRGRSYLRIGRAGGSTPPRGSLFIWCAYCSCIQSACTVERARKCQIFMVYICHLSRSIQYYAEHKYSPYYPAAAIRLLLRILLDTSRFPYCLQGLTSHTMPLVFVLHAQEAVLVLCSSSCSILRDWSRIRNRDDFYREGNLGVFILPAINKCSAASAPEE